MNKSYLKWAGGKARILTQLLKALPKADVLIEPFAGSCTVALNYPAKYKALNDLNSDLINCHRQCRDNPIEVITTLRELYQLGRDSYYDLRDEFNKKECSNLRLAALFIYLNKHGFNGMCRYSKNGFNIPKGNSKTIHFPDTEILKFSKLLGDTTHIKFFNTSFEGMFKAAPANSLIYCDPPYTPASATLSDVVYTVEGFTHIQHKALVELAKEAMAKNITTVISNHDLPTTRNMYRDATRIIEVSAFRSISRDSEVRGTVKEIIAIYQP